MTYDVLATDPQLHCVARREERTGLFMFGDGNRRLLANCPVSLHSFQPKACRPRQRGTLTGKRQHVSLRVHEGLVGAPKYLQLAINDRPRQYCQSRQSLLDVSLRVIFGSTRSCISSDRKFSCSLPVDIFCVQSASWQQHCLALALTFKFKVCQLLQHLCCLLTAARQLQNFECHLKFSLRPFGAACHCDSCAPFPLSIS